MKSRNYNSRKSFAKKITRNSNINLYAKNDNSKRLIIDEIIINNFKSYGGEHKIGKFDSNLTFIVGPNGCGKSNLVESLIFLFGKRANWLRFKQLKELIHNSNSLNNLDSAYVKVVFKEIENDNVINTFSIKRIINKKNYSNYQIDDKNCKKADVENLLKSKNLDLINNRFMILQGEVEQISSMPPKSGNYDSPGLLEYLEEIIGTIKYHSVIESKNKELEILLLEKNQSFNIMDILKKDLDSLEDNKEKALDFFYKEKEIYILKIFNENIKIHELNLKKEVEDSKLAEMYKESELIKSEFKEKLKEKNKYLNKLGDLNLEYKKTDENFTLKKSNFMKKKEIINNNIWKKNIISKEIKENKTEILKLQKKIQNQENPSNTLEIKNNLLAEKEENKQQLIIKNNKITDKYTYINKESNTLIDDINKKDTKLIDLNRKIEKLNENKNKIENEKKDIEIKENKQIEKLKKNDEQILDYQKKISDFKKKKLKNEEILKINNDKIKEKDEELNVVINKKKIIISNIREADIRITDIQKNDKETNTQNLILKFLKDKQREGEISGILGRLGDMATIHYVYEKAIIAATSCLNYIVVKNFETSKKCLNLLKKEKIGRGEFISIDKIPQNLDEEIDKFNKNTFPNFERLFDKLSFNQNSQIIRKIFYYFLRNTLVTKSLKCATELAYSANKIRIVTLDGKLFEINKTMVGGIKYKEGLIKTHSSNQIKNNNQTSKPKNINHYKKILEENQKELSNINEEENKLKNEKNILKTDYDQINSNIENIYLNLNKLIVEYRQLKNEIEDIKKYDKNSLIKELETLEEKIKLKENKLKEEEKITFELKEKLNELGGEELKILNEEKQKLETKKENINNKLLKIEQEENSQKYFQNENEKKIKELDIECEKLKKELEDNENLNNELTKSLDVIINEIKICRQNKIELEKQILELKKDDEIHEKVVKEFQNKKDKILKEINDIKSKINFIDNDIKEITDKINNLIHDYKFISKEYFFVQKLNLIEEIKLINKKIKEETNSNHNMNEEELDKNHTDKKNKGSDNLKEFMKYINKNYTKNMDNNFEFDKMTINEYSEINKDLENIIENNKKFLKENKANIDVLNTYSKKGEEFIIKRRKYDSKEKSFNELSEELEKITLERINLFNENFIKILKKLKEIYNYLTKEGDIELEYIDSFDPFSEGIKFIVRPPNKSWKEIHKLSGGEKTLSSISLIFALHHFKPNPLYFMDEIDAALDFRNVAIVAKYISQQTINAQFIVVSLRNNMYEIGKKLIGVYKTNNISKTVNFVI